MIIRCLAAFLLGAGFCLAIYTALDTVGIVAFWRERFGDRFDY